MSEELAWAAGIFEGEGCVYITYPHGADRCYANAAVAMTDRDVLVRLHAILGGTLGRERDPGGGRKTMSRWGVYGWDAVDDLYCQIGSWLGERRSTRFTEILALRPEPYDPGAIGRAKTHCPRGHAYSPENTYITKAGTRSCRACKARSCAKRRAELTMEIVAQLA